MKKDEQLRSGYTTGSCATLATKAALKMLLEEQTVEKEKILTPKGVEVEAAILDIRRENGCVSCAVQKDAGDDPDVTNGIYIYATVEKIESGVEIDGGIGVGRVTKRGLSQEIGEAAINPVPKKMMQQEIEKLLEQHHANFGIKVIISVPEGEKIAKKTFNPRLGIVGGISILGTTGIVDPMSEKALLDTIYLEMKFARENGIKNLILTPGNYGETFIRETLHLDLKQAVTCSNFVGEAIDKAVELEFESILMIGHMGKLVKLAAGIMNTHSHQADGRMEVLTAHAAMQGAPVALLKQVMECISTDEAIKKIKEYDLLESTMESVMGKVQYHLVQRCGDEVKIGAILFSNVHGILGKTETAEELLNHAIIQNLM